jgi:hypothetical protein
MQIRVALLCILPFALLACVTKPTQIPSTTDSAPVSVKPAQTAPTADTPKPTEVPLAQQPAQSKDDDVVATFDNVAITKKTFNTTKTEIQLIVEDLNKITFDRNYSRWLTFLSDEYRQNFSDPEVLSKVSDSLPTKGIRLKNLKDYFNYVFVPSRQNMRVDDIQFVSATRVYVIMEITPNSPAAIYILEKTSSGWKLVMKNQ